MSGNKIGNQTLFFRNKPIVSGAGTVVGVKEGKGPMSVWFDAILEEDMFGEKSWEKAESKMLKEAMEKALQKSGRNKSEIDVIFSGDLLNQLMSSSFMARDMKLPFIGLYGACSTMAESMLMSAVFIDGGFGKNVIAGASSHYCTAERQFRMPLEHGNQRPPTAQWTATAAGAVIISEGLKNEDFADSNFEESGGGPTTEKKVSEEKGIYDVRNIVISHGTLGKIIDPGIKDANQMGAAMAPAAVDTILTHFDDTGRDMDYYDIVLTGDLGFIGKDIAIDLLSDAGIDKATLKNKFDDCGTMMYEKNQDVHSGGSGCGCSATVFSGYVFQKMQKGDFKNALIISTGAMLSTISPFQGETIPGIAHAVSLESGLY